MILTELAAQVRLNSPDNLTRHIGSPYRAVTESSRNRTCLGDELKLFIGLLTVKSGETSRSVGDIFSLDHSTVNAIVRGEAAHSYKGNGDYKFNKEFNDKIEAAKEEVKLEKKEVVETNQDRAAAILSLALDSIPFKIGPNTSLRDLNSTAKNMASVIDVLSSKGKDGTLVKVEIYTPRALKEEHFDVIEVNSENF